MQKGTVAEETKGGTSDGAAPSTGQPPVDSINQIQDQCNNFMLDLDSGQRVTEASPEQRVGTTLCKMRDLNTLLSRLILALDRQIVQAATDTIKLQHLMRLQQNTNLESIQEAAQIAHEVAEAALEPTTDESSKSGLDHTTATTDADDTDDDAGGSGDAGGDVPPPECDDAGRAAPAAGDASGGEN